jgi:hypothetical protein
MMKGKVKVWRNMRAESVTVKNVSDPMYSSPSQIEHSYDTLWLECKVLRETYYENANDSHLLERR